MKELILEVFEGLLNFALLVYAIIGFIAGGSIGILLHPFGGGSFSIDGAVAGALVFLLIGVFQVGAAYVLIRIKELMESQLSFMERIERQRQRTEQPSVAATTGPIVSLQNSAPVVATRVPVPATQRSLNRCPKCNSILPSDATSCRSCGHLLA